MLFLPGLLPSAVLLPQGGKLGIKELIWEMLIPIGFKYLQSIWKGRPEILKIRNPCAFLVWLHYTYIPTSVFNHNREFFFVPMEYVWDLPMIFVYLNNTDSQDIFLLMPPKYRWLCLFSPVSVLERWKCGIIGKPVALSHQWTQLMTAIEWSHQSDRCPSFLYFATS